MTTVDFNAIGIAIRDHLRDNITDPLGDTPNRIWIHYDDPTNPARIGKTPAIFVQALPSDKYFEGVGLNYEWLLQFTIHVLVRDMDKGYISGSLVSSTKELLDKITGQVEEQMKVITNSNINFVTPLSLGGHIPVGEQIVSYAQTWGVAPK